MPELLKELLIVCPLVFLAGFVDSVAGGGGLIAIPAYLLAGLPAQLAAGTNKLTAGCGSVISGVKYVRSGKFQLRPVLFGVVGAIAGSAAGASLAAKMPEAVFKTILLAALPAVAVFLAVKRDFGAEKSVSPEQQAAVSQRKQDIVSLLIGLALGCYDGLVGPGTGTFMIMAFTAFLSMDLVTAAGSSRITNLTANLSAAAVWALNGHVAWRLVLPAAACSLAGNYLGARYAIRGGSKRVRGMIFVVLGLLFAKMLYDLLA